MYFLGHIAQPYVQVKVLAQVSHLQVYLYLFSGAKNTVCNRIQT